MAITSKQVSVGTTATLLVAPGRSTIVMIAPAGAGTYLGGPGVTVSNGFALNDLPSKQFELDRGADLYAIKDSGNTVVAVLILDD